MPDPKHFYITTTLPYVNADPHVGFAMEIIRADVIARYKKMLGYTVFFNTGTDEHGQKIYQKAQESGQEVQEYVDGYAQKFRGLIDALGILPEIHFIRTTDDHHIVSAQEFWKRCQENGYIYKKNYQIKYCVGCELEKTDSELDHGKCPLHPQNEIENIQEENYFFKFSAFQKPLLDFYDQHPDFVLPDFRLKEIRAFVERGLEDFSISRLKEKMPWGVPVPDDEYQVMYVWFDALVNYISTLGWPDNVDNFDRFWCHGTPTQIAGKDNLRQQSAMWQAMLMSVNLPTSHQVLINGFINSDGQKMSKSLGNIISPYDLVRDYGTDALRYYLLRHVHQYEDSDMTKEKFHVAYNANLANGIGNLASRLLALTEKYLTASEIAQVQKHVPVFSSEYASLMESYRFDLAMDMIWKAIGNIDQQIAEKKPFILVKEDMHQAKEVLVNLLLQFKDIVGMLQPLLPDTSEKIASLIELNKKPEAPLFTRKDEIH